MWGGGWPRIPGLGARGFMRRGHVATVGGGAAKRAVGCRASEVGEMDVEGDVSGAGVSGGGAKRVGALRATGAGRPFGHEAPGASRGTPRVCRELAVHPQPLENIGLRSWTRARVM